MNFPTLNDLEVSSFLDNYSSLISKGLSSIDRQEFEKIAKLKFDVVQDNQSSSTQGTLRGIHFQTHPYAQAKLVRVLVGEVYDVAVDLRKNSKTFGKYFSLIISDKSDYSFYVPEGFAHGFLCLSDKCIVHYKCSEYRHKAVSYTHLTLPTNREV